MNREAIATALMESFAERTGLVGPAPPCRYLWTDAFAVTTFLSLHRRQPKGGFVDLARTLVAQVHDVLGRHAAGPQRGRPLGGQDEAEHVDHPTRAGLRIGKPLPERGVDDPIDERLEWERDGQYFHYLTRWMQALERFARATGEVAPHRWAVELCAASLAFVEHDARGRPERMVWKRSVDLDRVLVPSMGQHDPLEGWVTSAELAASPWVSDDEREMLFTAEATFRALDAPNRWPSADPLGLGSLLDAAGRRWFDRGVDSTEAVAEVRQLLAAATRGLRSWIETRPFDHPARARLAFRELGLVIGLQAVEAVVIDPECDVVVAEAAQPVRGFAAAMPDLIAFWCEPRHQIASSWTDHPDINAVMLAASLVPEDPEHVPIQT